MDREFVESVDFASKSIAFCGGKCYNNLIHARDIYICYFVDKFMAL